MKVTAAELDALILLIARLSLRQLQRVDTIVNAQMLGKMASPNEEIKEEKGA